MDTPAYKRDGLALSLAVGVVGLTFGVFAESAALTVGQAMGLSALTFTGASQFAFVTVIANGGTAIAATVGAIALAMRNSLYGPALTDHLPMGGFRKFVTAHFIIDETTAMALGHVTFAKRSFWWTAIWLYSLWNVGTLVGFLFADRISDPAAFGLDAAFPAAFLAMLVPIAKEKTSAKVAIAAGVIAAIAVPIVPAGVPIFLAALGVLAGSVRR